MTPRKTVVLPVTCLRKFQTCFENAKAQDVEKVINNGDWRSYGVMYYFGLDLFKKFLKPSNLPSDPGCERLNVNETVCDDFTRYRVLLCDNDQWKQSKCVDNQGNCSPLPPWPFARDCRYATNGNDVLLCHDDVRYCRLMCSKVNGKYRKVCKGRRDRRVRNDKETPDSVVKQMGLKKDAAWEYLGNLDG